MHYPIEPRERRYVKGYGFLSFAKNIGRNLSNKYGQKLVDTPKKSKKKNTKRKIYISTRKTKNY